MYSSALPLRIIDIFEKLTSLVWKMRSHYHLKEKNKLIETGFEYVHCSEQDEVAI